DVARRPDGEAEAALPAVHRHRHTRGLRGAPGAPGRAPGEPLRGPVPRPQPLPDRAGRGGHPLRGGPPRARPAAPRGPRALALGGRGGAGAADRRVVPVPEGHLMPLPIRVGFLHPELLLLLLVIPALGLAWRAWPPPASRGRARLSLALRSLLVALLVFSLAGARLSTQPTKRAVVAVVDLSDSVRANDADREEAIRSLISAKGGDDVFGIVTV